MMILFFVAVVVQVEVNRSFKKFPTPLLIDSLADEIVFYYFFIVRHGHNGIQMIVYGSCER